MSGSRQQFDRVAGHYDETLPAHVAAHYLGKRVALMTALAGSDGLALDVGCGTGALGEALSRAGWCVTGVDASLGMLRLMRDRAGRAVQGEAYGLPWPEGQFDLVYTVATLHQIAEPASVRRTLEEMARVCRPGGVTVVWDHNPLNPYWPVVMKRVPQDTGAERLVPAEEIVAGLSAQPGMEVQRVRHSGFVPDFAPRLLLPVFRLLEWVVERLPVAARHACAHNVVVARKADPARAGG